MNTAIPHMAGLRSEPTENRALDPNRRLRIRIDIKKPAAADTVQKNGIQAHTGQKASIDQDPRPDRRKLKAFTFRNVAIPYGHYKSGKTSYWMLFYRDGSKRIRESRVSFEKLRKRAEEIALSIANGQIAMSQFTEDQRASYRRCCELAAQVNAPLELLVAEAVEARKKASMSNIVRKTCPEIYTELIKQMTSRAGSRWVEDIESRVGDFVGHYTGPLADLRAADFETYLNRLNVSERTWNNYRTAIGKLVSFARENKYVPKDWDELKLVKPFKIQKPEAEEIYTPEEIRSMLFTAEKYYPQHLATLAIMALAGCRHSELRDDDGALDWKDVHLKSGKIHISEALAKSNTGRRYVPMQPNLVAWLEHYAKPRGPVCAVDNLTNALARIAKKAKVKWKRNALRNSFISYRCAVTHDVARVAEEAGNSVQEIQDSYRRELTEEEGKAWFEIWPTKADVLPLFAYGKVS